MSSSPQNVPSSEELYQLLMENVRDYAIFTTDPHNRITTWNEGAERILGYQAEEMIGQDAALIFTPEDRTLGAVAVELTRTEETGRAENERWHVKKDGSRFWGSGILTALRAADGTLRGYVKIMRDLTERKQAQYNLDALNQQLLRLNHQLHNNLTETYHRVKNNLQVASALVDVITQTDTEAIFVSEVKRVGQHIRAMASIHDLLTQEAKADATASGISCQGLVEKLVPLLQQTVGSRQLRFAVEDVRLPAKTGSALAILINELVTNATKHGEGTIEVSLKRERVQLSVSDEGPGFPAGFDLRQTAHTGLELVEGLSRLDLEGEVVFANRAGGGASVILTFPLPLT